MQHTIVVKIHSFESPHHTLSAHKISTPNSLDTSLYSGCRCKTAILGDNAPILLQLNTGHENI
jgi:hypothetical protein